MGRCRAAVASALAIPAITGCTGNSRAQVDPQANTSLAQPASPSLPAYPPENDVDEPNRGRIRIGGRTHAMVRVDLDPSLAGRLAIAKPGAMVLASSAVQPLADRLRAAGMDPAIFDVVAHSREGTGDLQIRLSVRGGADRRSYRIAWVALQGTARWARSVSRPSGINPDYRGIADESGRPTGNPGYESIQMDVGILAKRFAEAVEIGGDG